MKPNMKMLIKKLIKVKLHRVASRVFQHEYDHMEGIDFTTQQ